MTEVAQAQVMEGDWLRTDECEYNWVAIYSDGQALTQYWEDEEVSFGDIDQNRIAGFCITDGPNIVGVDLNSGVFTINNAQLALTPDDENEAPRRLIFFRRHTQVVSFGAGQLSDDIMYCIGWQRTNELDNGEQRCEKQILGVMDGLRIIVLEE